MEDRLMTLAYFSYAHRAHILRGLLEQAGINAIVSTKTVLDCADGVRIQVREKDLDAAIKIMKDAGEEYNPEEVEKIENK
ncbi:MAG: hypothetical protein C0594_04405 [Marinilabiliales bacterium]|nr:MAG: hypothetical protein C0594_04405 [Marinilabiliales bacterium]